MESKKNKTTHTSDIHNKENAEEYLSQLQDEIHEFEREKEHIRKIMGEIGGKKFSYKETILNISFAVIAITLLIGQLFFGIFTSLVSIELAIFLISIKIIWMIHMQNKHNHFMFWVLNTIEFRLNDLYKLTLKVQKSIDASTKQ